MRLRYFVPRYSLRALIVGTTSIALAFAAIYNFWWHPLRERDTAVSYLASKKVKTDDLVLSDPGYPTHARPVAPPPTGTYLEQLLQKDHTNRSIKSITFVRAPQDATDEDLRVIATLESVEHLDLTRIAGSITKYPGGGYRSRSRNIGAPRITDAGIAHIAHLPHLRWLIIARSKVTDATCAELSHSRSLETISLDETSVTDEGLMALAKIPTLKFVGVREAPISEGGIAKFRAMRPDVQVLSNH